MREETELQTVADQMARQNAEIAKLQEALRLAAEREAETVKAALDSASGRSAMVKMQETINATASTGKR